MEPFKVEQRETERQIHSDEASSSLPSPNLQPKSPSLKSRRVTVERMMHNFSKNSEDKDVNVANNEDAYNLDFFKSLLPLIRGWTNLAKIEFRTDVLGLIKRYNETQNW